MRFLRNAASVFATSVVMAPVGLATSVLLARELGADSFGLWALATSFASLVVIASQLGWQSASIYRLRRGGTPPSLVFTTSAVAALVLSAVGAGLALAFRDVIERELLPGAPPVVFHLALASVPFQLLTLVFGALARGIDRFDLTNACQLARALAILAAVAVIAAATDDALVPVLASVVVVHALSALGLGAAVARLTGVSPRADAAELIATARFGVRSWAQNLAGQLHERLDLFMLAVLLDDPAAVGVYAVAVRVIDRLKLFPEAAGAALYPQAAGLQEDAAGRFAASVSRHSFLWVVMCAAALAVLAPVLVPLLFGARYAASIPPLQILLVGMALLTIYRILGRYFIAVGRQRVNLVTQLASTALNVALNLWWIPRYGILGAAWASLVSYTLEAALIATAFRRDSGQSLRDVLVIRRADLSEYSTRLQPLLRSLGWTGKS